MNYKDTALKVLSIIDTCRTVAQLATAQKLVELFEKKYNEKSHYLRMWMRIKATEIKYL